ncbi:uncharacterized protein CELE_ZK512.7 [Caenorhabditis elegans]|uniref:Uncharacterized protein ZK512.7 n=1 Tax=Caenorhabditis elegans TaxID=6239 RepID=YOQ7_CAEEL|nr:Uncharacterized protein CELE_ZK512.7 [Caenorhabditis elegans]P34645.1 RecName: Full=Uncharacterized protein ZK512.7 [Caenorhabditis elegans]CAA80147.1 Uncharacterized protein CELE_ZK512.7 [Caenorhabditis elegans]|eukprot:NP_499024.1 Uncharacterized protein CELE_ZK512.7 [Caenorhabditis elegans]
MQFFISSAILFSYAFCQSIPNVILTGEPRVVARRILNVDMKAAQQLALPDDQQHVRYQVNVVRNQENPSDSTYLTGERTPVTVYRRILRPARITFTGDGVITDSWQGTSDAVEMESWTLNRRPTIDGSFVQPTQNQQGAFH